MYENLWVVGIKAYKLTIKGFRYMSDLSHILGKVPPFYMQSLTVHRGKLHDPLKYQSLQVATQYLM